MVICHPLRWWLGLCRFPHLLSLPSPTKISVVEASQSLFNWWVLQPFLLEIQWWVKFYGSFKRIKLHHVKYNFLRIRLRLVLVAREWLRWTLKRNFKNKNNKKRNFKNKNNKKKKRKEKLQSLSHCYCWSGYFIFIFYFFKILETLNGIKIGFFL